MNKSPITAALASLQLERDNLAARLSKVDALIDSMRDVFHLAKPPKLNGHGGARQGSGRRPALSADAFRAALKNGPMPPRALAAALNVTVANLRYAVANMVDEGVLQATGTTASRRIFLAATPEKARSPKSKTLRRIARSSPPAVPQDDDETEWTAPMFTGTDR